MAILLECDDYKAQWQQYENLNTRGNAWVFSFARVERRPRPSSPITAGAAALLQQEEREPRRPPPHHRVACALPEGAYLACEFPSSRRPVIRPISCRALPASPVSSNVGNLTPHSSLAGQRIPPHWLRWRPPLEMGLLIARVARRPAKTQPGS
jgi:hypothetical protein